MKSRRGGATNSHPRKRNMNTNNKGSSIASVVYGAIAAVPN